MRFSRRQFLQTAGWAAAAAWMPPVPPEEAPRPAEMYGRATKALAVFDRPSQQANVRRYFMGDTVFPIYDTVIGPEEAYNRNWYRVAQGFVYSGVVQPVRWTIQTPEAEVPEGGFLGEVSVPYTVARGSPRPNSLGIYRFYYSTTYWVKDRRTDDSGVVWCQVLDDRLEKFYWVLASHLRRVTDEEMAPLAPGAAKRIEIDLEKQTFRCYQDGALALDTLCATGPYLRTENGQRIFSTPAGNWEIGRKRPSRHMAGDDGASADFFDLPGVPWVSYFHWWGVSIHGTYWHNDYGRPRSHGCINLPSETAKWVYRWSLPQAALSDGLQTLGAGTSVIVY